MAVERTIQGYFLPVAGLVPLLGAEDGGLLLGLADEEHPFGAGKRRAVLGRDVVLALPLGEREQRDAVPLDEPLDGGDEGLADRVHQRGRREWVSAVVAQEPDDALLALQVGHVHVEVHAVDAFDFQGDVLAQDSGDGAR